MNGMINRRIYLIIQLEIIAPSYVRSTTFISVIIISELDSS